jgi:dTDP-4-dehydrorhamnose reductase
MRVTIFGASGLLGKALVREWKKGKGDEVFGLSSRDADLRDAAQVAAAVERTRPEWIVLAAAYTDVDGCESDPERAFSVNRDGAVNVAEGARRAGVRLLFLSSDYVFDGTKHSPYEIFDARNPQSIYGRSKAEAELRLSALLPECCIVRTSWLFGVGGKCFPDTLLKLAATRPSLDVVNDQRGCPTYSIDLAEAIIQLCHKKATGIVHVTNAGDCSWFEFAQAIVLRAGLSTAVQPVTTEQMPRPARRPAYSVLSPSSLQQSGITLPAWQSALRRYLQERMG